MVIPLHLHPLLTTSKLLLPHLYRMLFDVLRFNHRAYLVLSPSYAYPSDSISGYLMIDRLPSTQRNVSHFPLYPELHSYLQKQIQPLKSWNQ
jgi:hypothetical protein